MLEPIQPLIFIDVLANLTSHSHKKPEVGKK